MFSIVFLSLEWKCIRCVGFLKDRIACVTFIPENVFYSGFPATAALVMMNEDEIDTYYYFASVAFYAYASTIPPMLMVSYRNNTGIEPYYTYATLGGANAGTAYVADATGQLKVAKELLSYAFGFHSGLTAFADPFALPVGKM